VLKVLEVLKVLKVLKAKGTCSRAPIK